MGDDLARIASSLTFGRNYKEGNFPLFGRGTAMNPIGIDAVIASDKDYIAALAPLHDEWRES